MTTPPAGPQEARDVLASVEFVHGICPACSGSQPDHDDDCRIAAALSGAAVRGGAPAALREAAMAYREHVQSRGCDHSALAGTHTSCPEALALDLALSENTVDSLDDLDVDRLAEAMTWWHRDGWRDIPDDVLWPSRNRDYDADTATEDRIAAAAILRRLTATAASDAAEEADMETPPVGPRPSVTEPLTARAIDVLPPARAGIVHPANHTTGSGGVLSGDDRANGERHTADQVATAGAEPVNSNND